MTYEVIAKTRSVQGSGASRRLRNSGTVPAVVYGGGQAAVSIELDHNAIFHQLKREAFHSSVLSLNIDGKTEMALLRDVQYHAYKPLIQHVDFQRVAADEKIHMSVPLHFKGAEACPGVKLHGGSVNHILSEVEVLCLPANLPEFIEVDLSNLAAGHSIHLSDLVLPAGVELAALVRGDNLGVAALIGAKGGAAAA